MFNVTQAGALRVAPGSDEPKRPRFDLIFVCTHCVCGWEVEDYGGTQVLAQQRICVRIFWLRAGLFLLRFVRHP
jgi:hypothetical protein